MDKKIIALIGIGILGVGSFVLMSQGKPTYYPGGVAGGISKKEDALIDTVTETPTEPGAPVYNITFPEPNFPEVPQFDYAQILALSDGNGETVNYAPKKTYQSPSAIVREIQEIVRTPGMSPTRTKTLIEDVRKLESTKKEKTVQEIVRTPGMSAQRTVDIAEKIKAMQRSQNINTKKSTILLRTGFNFGGR